jgi:hypothetical protein
MGLMFAFRKLLPEALDERAGIFACPKETLKRKLPASAG